jgi:recombination protein RecT
MTAQTVTNAVATRDNGPGALIKKYSSDFQMVLPEHLKPATFVRLAQGVLRRDANLARVAQKNPASLMAALLECARLGHEPGTDSFYLVPFGNEIQGIEGYRGVVERIFRAGAVSSVKAELVYEKDHYRFNPTQMQVPEFEPDDFATDRGALIGAFAYAEMKDGSVSRVVRINRTYIEKVRAQSRGSNSASSPWKQWYDQMVLKTVLRRLEPFVPTSTEFRREELRSAQHVAAEQRPAAAPRGAQTQPVDVSHLPEINDDDDVVDAEVVDPDAATAEEYYGEQAAGEES